MHWCTISHFKKMFLRINCIHILCYLSYSLGLPPLYFFSFCSSFCDSFPDCGNRSSYLFVISRHCQFHILSPVLHSSQHKPSSHTLKKEKYLLLASTRNIYITCLQPKLLPGQNFFQQRRVRKIIVTLIIIVIQIFKRKMYTEQLINIL